MLLTHRMLYCHSEQQDIEQDMINILSQIVEGGTWEETEK